MKHKWLKINTSDYFICIISEQFKWAFYLYY